MSSSRSDCAAMPSRVADEDRVVAGDGARRSRGCPASSIACASALAYPDGVVTTTSVAAGSTVSGVPAHGGAERAQAVAVARAGRRIDQPCRSERAPSRARARRCRARRSSARPRSRSPGAPTRPRACVDSARSRTSSRIALCRSRRFIVCGTLAQYACSERESAASTSLRRSTVSGGARRRTFSPALRTRSPCSRAASTTSAAAARSSSMPDEQAARPGRSTTPASDGGSCRGSRSRAPSLARGARRRSLDDGARSGAGDRVARRTSIRGRPARTRPRRRRRRGARRSGARSRGPSRGSRDRGARRAARRRRTCPVRPTPVCTSSTAEQRRGSADAAATKSASSGTTPPSPRIGSSRTSPTSLVDGGLERTRRRSAARSAHRRGAARRPLACRAARSTDSAPSVLPWKPPSSATTPRFPVSLACVLERGLDRLRARVAEEGLRTAEPLGQELRELLAGSRAVQVRRVPEPVELRVRSRERSRMAVAERDDGDPAAEVEVLAAVASSQTRQPSPRTIVRSARA